MAEDQVQYRFASSKAAFAEVERLIRDAFKEGVTDISLFCFGLTRLPESIGRLKELTLARLGLALASSEKKYACFSQRNES